MKYLVLAVVLSLFTVLTPLRAEDEKAIAVQQMQRVVTLIEQMSVWVEDLDLARLHLVRRRTEAVLTAIQQNGLANSKTMLQYQHLIVTFRYSTAFFRQIDADEIHDQLVELRQLFEETIKARGFDDSPYTQITADTFTQLYNLVQQLRDVSDIPSDLSKALGELTTPLGQVIAVAKLGDRPKTFEAAIPMYRKIAKLYPAMNGIARSNAAFDIVLDIEGLNEFYADYAQIDR